MCEGNAPDAKLQQLSCCPQAWRPNRFERMGSRAGSRPTDGRLASEKDSGLIFARRANRSLLSDVVSSVLRRPCVNHWSTTTTIADELTQLSTQLVLNKTMLLDYQNDRTEARRLTTISVGVLLALPMRSPPVKPTRLVWVNYSSVFGTMPKSRLHYVQSKLRFYRASILS